VPELSGCRVAVGHAGKLGDRCRRLWAQGAPVLDSSFFRRPVQHMASSNCNLHTHSQLHGSLQCSAAAVPDRAIDLASTVWATAKYSSASKYF
jgi:hypothetical protein